MHPIKAERVTDQVTHHGEGPFWDVATQRLLFVDMLAATVLTRDLTGRIETHKVPGRAATVIRRRTVGGYAIATDSGLLGADVGLVRFEELAPVISDPAVRLNEGGCDPGGRFFIGSMAYDEHEGGGALYRVDADHSVRTLLPGVTISNGLQWSRNGKLAHYIDTPTRRVDVFDVDPATGGWSNRRPHILLDNTPGHPDGMAIDEHDGLWVALWGGGAIHHYDSSGAFVEAISVPGASQVTACAFGGADRDVLFITTSRKGLAPDQEPAAGCLHAVATDVRGAPAHEYAG